MQTQTKYKPMTIPVPQNNTPPIKKSNSNPNLNNVNVNMASSSSPPPNSIRNYKDEIEKILNDVEVKSSIDLIDELKRQIKEKYLSSIAIDNEMKHIAFKIFYFPSDALIKVIETKLETDYENILYKCIALRHGDLYLLETKVTLIPQINLEIKHVMENLIAWGSYFLDLEKLEYLSSTKKGNSADRVYLINELDLEIEISEGLNVKFKGQTINPSIFKNKILKEMAIERLRKQAIEAFYKVLLAEKIYM